jgi:hypothetical protein
MLNTIPPDSTRSFYVIYDTRTGDVVQTRGVTIMKGAYGSSDDEVTARARLSVTASKHRHGVTLEVIKVDPAVILPGRRYRVNVASKALETVD